MVDKLLRFRYILVIAIVFILVNSIFFIGSGISLCIHAYTIIFQDGFHADIQEKPGMIMGEALDAFMIAIVSMIFGLGLSKIFFYDHIEDQKIPKWLRINDLKGLKVILWEAILLTLVINSIKDLAYLGSNSWEALIPSLMILILSVSLYFMKKEPEK